MGISEILLLVYVGIAMLTFLVAANTIDNFASMVSYVIFWPIWAALLFVKLIKHTISEMQEFIKR